SAFVGLAIALAREAELHEFLAHRVGADWMSHRRQRLGELVHALRYPDQRAHGVTKRRRLDKTLQCRSESGVGRADGLAAGAGSTHLALGQRSSIQIVLPARPVIRETTARLPQPAALTSPAANNRRPRSSSFEPTVSQRVRMASSSIMPSELRLFVRNRNPSDLSHSAARSQNAIQLLFGVS